MKTLSDLIFLGTHFYRLFYPPIDVFSEKLVIENLTAIVSSC